MNNWKKRIDDQFNQFRNEAKKRIREPKGSFTPLFGHDLNASQDIDILI